MAKRLDNNFQFIEVGRCDPKKVPMADRTEGFGEIYETFKTEEAAEQSHRCLECGNPYCEWKCLGAQLHTELAQTCVGRKYH